MTTRREINFLHEAAVIGAALLAHNEQVGRAFKVESRPDPPDAVLVDGNLRTWMEHTDAFYPGWAEHLTSYAATDKVHRCPVPCDHIPVRSWPLFKARQLMRDVIESLQGEKKS